MRIRGARFTTITNDMSQILSIGYIIILTLDVLVGVISYGSETFSVRASFIGTCIFTFSVSVIAGRSGI